MPVPSHRPNGRALALIATLTAVIGAALPTVAGVGASHVAMAADAQPAGPSIQYLESVAHASDPNTFHPGSRVALKLRARPQVKALADPVPTETPSADPSAPADPSPSASADPSAAPTPLPPGPTSGSGLKRQVVGFLPYWEVNASDLTLRYDLLSTIAYFSVASDRNGNLVTKNSDGSASTGWAGWTSSSMSSIMTAAHAAGTRVALTITLFAWASSDRATQVAVLGNAAARQRLADQAAAAVAARGADGVNVDAEPIASGYADEFADFVHRLRTSLDSIAPGYEITVDVTGEVANYPLEALVAPGAADAIFIMGYDYRGSSTGNAGSIAPIAGPAYDLNETLGAFLARVPPDRVLLGLPYYGRAWSTVSDAPNARSQSGTKYGGSVTSVYTTAASLAEDNGRRYDDVEQSAWTAYQRQNCTSTYGCVTSWRELYFDDAQSLGAKYDLVSAMNLRGTGMWALGYDGTRPELWNALESHFVATPSVPAQDEPLTLTASTNVIQWGSQITLTASMGSANAGRLVDFEVSRDGMAFMSIGAQALDAGGHAIRLYAPSDNRYYRVVFQGAADLAPRQSTGLRVVVRQLSVFRPLPSGVRVVRPGSTVGFATTVRPSRSDLPTAVVRYVLYRLSGGRWQLVGTQDVTADASGVARWPVTFGGRGSWYVRSMALPTPLNANSAWSPLARYDSR